jgi:fucose permease
MWEHSDLTTDWVCKSSPAGIACLFMIFFFESICYPVIFSVATADLGGYAKIGGGLIAA